jgi:hypothetical protein
VNVAVNGMPFFVQVCPIVSSDATESALGARTRVADDDRAPGSYEAPVLLCCPPAHRDHHRVGRGLPARFTANKQDERVDASASSPQSGYEQANARPCFEPAAED